MGTGKENISKVTGDKVATVFGLWELFNDPHLLLKEIGLVNNRVYRDVPHKCCVCGHHRFSNLSLIGVYRKPVFYECNKCSALHLKYNEDWLATKVEGLKDAYINPNDWDNEPPKSEFN